jgi:pyruvate-ferredoxin/flavodoxin oxidoreductase
LVAKPIVESCEERRDFWILLRDLTGTKQEETNGIDLESKIRAEVVSKITQKLMQLAGANGATMPSTNKLVTSVEGQKDDHQPNNGQPANQQDNQQEAPQKAETSAQQAGGMAPWLESEDCTSCDECINLNSKIFAYNKDKQAYIKDAHGGPYQDLVIAAEKCTAQVIHPGLPADSTAKDMEKWIKRGEKFN